MSGSVTGQIQKSSFWGLLANHTASFMPVSELKVTHLARYARVIDQCTSTINFSCFNLHITLMPQLSNFQDSPVVYVSNRLEMDYMSKLMQTV